jgi:hypothetical protein
MIFVQFYQPSALNSIELVEACGDRGVVILDGRSTARHVEWAREECLKRGYKGWKLMKGENFSRSWPIGELEQM